ncbi:MAG: 50S ribosomal protein L25/general stress protein Ctc [Deltaproteobacteria bacterium]|nr:50S ribosomal protein L25/general stress protein Ctc [Deltaproteobacteria bacterium]
MEEGVLVAQFRTGRGKEQARRLRRQGLIPAIVYGHRVAPIPIILNAQYLAKVLRGEAGDRTLINLTIEGLGDGPISKTVILKEKQIDPLKRTLLHVDLYSIAMDEEVYVDVPIHIVGKAAGVEKGGVLEQILREIEVKCLPTDIPPRIEVDISCLDIGDVFHVEDIKLEKVKILADPEQAVVTVAPPAVLEEAVAEEEIIEEEEKEEVEEKEEE